MPSSPITEPVVQPERLNQLLGLLATVPGPRDPREVCYWLAGALVIAVSAVMSGARSFTAVGQWGGELFGQQLERLGHYSPQLDPRGHFTRGKTVGGPYVCDVT